MRKITLILLMLALLLMPIPVMAGVTPHDVHVQIEHALVDFPDAKPFIDEAGRIQVPVRFVSSHLGYDVHWAEHESEYSVILTSAASNVIITSDSSKAIVDGVEVDMDTTPARMDNRIYVPLRFLAELEAYTVEWDADNAVAILHQQDHAVASVYAAPEWKLFSEMTATAYTAPKNKKGEFEARTYSGNIVGLGDIAVDPNVIPLGSTLFIEGYDFDGLPEGGMLGRATDIGGAIKGNKVDIFVPVSHHKASEFGFQKVKVYVLEE